MGVGWAAYWAGKLNSRSISAMKLLPCVQWEGWTRSHLALRHHNWKSLTAERENGVSPQVMGESGGIWENSGISRKSVEEKPFE